VCYWRAANLTE